MRTCPPHVVAAGRLPDVGERLGSSACPLTPERPSDCCGALEAPERDSRAAARTAPVGDGDGPDVLALGRGWAGGVAATGGVAAVVGAAATGSPWLEVSRATVMSVTPAPRTAGPLNSLAVFRWVVFIRVPWRADRRPASRERHRTPPGRGRAAMCGCRWLCWCRRPRSA